jgi:cystathionine gamma-synthase
LRELADEYGFLIIVDETVGNFVNVEVASWADIVVSSLTKVFSGDTNVMGGRCVNAERLPYRTADIILL